VCKRYLKRPPVMRADRISVYGPINLPILTEVNPGVILPMSRGLD